ncbi:hypothetical protein [Methylosinus sp. PW1]|uniref:hypothetical protein n=1 Tax=Methylosinus sp. PW1 TaxID=107636 RepID=UPI0012EB94D6|nr:hypothetical protein [Methylosinus sp. PW1]
MQRASARPSGDRQKQSQQRGQSFGGGAGKAIQERRRQLLSGDGRHEGGRGHPPERACGEDIAPPLAPALNRVAACADKVGELANRRRRAIAYRRNQHDDRAEKHLAPRENRNDEGVARLRQSCTAQQKLKRKLWSAPSPAGPPLGLRRKLPE